MEARGIEVVADVPSEQGQADFAADVSKLKESGAEAVFVYLNEEESARFLKEAAKQGLKVPLVGEVTLTGQKVIELAGDAANGAFAHVGITTAAACRASRNSRRSSRTSTAAPPTTTASRATSASMRSSTAPSSSASSTARPSRRSSTA